MIEVTDKNVVRVKAIDNLNKLNGKQFLRVDPTVALLPYYEQHCTRLDDHLQHLINGFSVTIVTENMMDTVSYLKHFRTYLSTFKARMTKQTTIDVLKLLYDAMTREKQNVVIIKECADTLVAMIDHFDIIRLCRRDVVLDWKPLYKLYTDAANDKIRNLKKEKLVDVVMMLSTFFAAEEQPAIWESIQEFISMHHMMGFFSEMCFLFLSTEMMSVEEHKKYGCGVWFDTLWSLFSTVDTNNGWGSKLMSLFSKLAFNSPHAMDLSPYYETVFTRMIRSFELMVRDGKTHVGDGAESSGVTFYANFVAGTLGGPNSCLPHLTRTMKCIESFVHPQNSGSHIDQIVNFLERVLKFVVDRVKWERYKKHKREVPSEYSLKDDEIHEVCKYIIGPLMMIIYSEQASYQQVSGILSDLAALDHGLVVPKFLDHMYSALFAVDEPHRLAATMDSFLVLLFKIIGDDEKACRRRLKFEEDWVERMEKERRKKPEVQIEMAKIRTTPKKRATRSTGSSFKTSSSTSVDKESEEDGTTFRQHVIYMLEAIVDMIDINDVGRTESALKTLVIVFSSVPLIDCTEVPKHWGKEMTDDDLRLCELTARLPQIALKAFDKILRTVEYLSMSAPKDSSTNMGTMHDFQTSNGSEEKVLKSAIDECCYAIFAHSDPKLAEKLVDRFYEFVRTNQFESYTATDLLSGILGSCTLVMPKAFNKFLTFLVDKISLHFTPEVQKQKEPPSAILYYAVLASTVFTVRTDRIVENEEKICELIGTLLQCENRTAYMAGAGGLGNIIFQLTQIYSLSHFDVNEKMGQSFEKWNPLKDWAKVHDLHEITLSWHVPSHNELAMVERMCGRFLFPYLDKLHTKMERDDLRRTLYILTNLIIPIQACLSRPDSPVVSSSYFSHLMPSPINHLTVQPVHSMDWELKSPRGENVYEVIMSAVESCMANVGHKDPKALSDLANLASMCIDTTIQEKSDLTTMANISNTLHRFFVHPFLEKKRIPLGSHALKASQLNALIARMTTDVSATQFDLRVMKSVVRLAMNDYEDVRSIALGVLASSSRKFAQCREFLIDDVVGVLANINVHNEEAVKGSLSLIVALGWPTTGNLFVRRKVWNAVVRMKPYDEPLICSLFETFHTLVQSIGDTEMKQRVLDVDDEGKWELWEKRNASIREHADRLIQTSASTIWTDLVTRDGLIESRKKKSEHMKTAKKEQEEMVAELLAGFVNNKEIHHTREKLARTMIYRCQRETSGEATVKIMVQQLIHDEKLERDEARAEIYGWLKFNKPKTVRIDFVPPENTTDSEKRLKCGIRPDNLFIAYDSENLPDTEEKWNEMIFLSKQMGCFKWPKTINVVRKAKDGPAIESRELSAAEKVICEFFENEQNVMQWVMWMRHEKESQVMTSIATYTIIKYLIRNFPSSIKIYQHFANVMRQLLRCKGKDDQRMAADLFVGIVKGIRHRPFQMQKEFWEWAAPETNSFLNRMSSEAQDAWLDAISTVLENSGDQRRCFWLVEELINGMKKSNTSAWRQCLRLELIPADKWRYQETRKRICEIAWKKTPHAMTDILRSAIGNSLRSITSLREANWNNEFENVPERFQLKEVDYWIERFLINIKSLSPAESETHSMGTDTPMSIPPEQAPRVSPNSPIRPNKRVRSAPSLGQQSSSDSESDDGMRAPMVKRQKRMSPSGSKQRKRSSSRSSTSSACSDSSDGSDVSEVEEKESMIYLRTFLEYLMCYYENCYKSWSPALLQVLPKLFDYSNEDDCGLSEEAYKDVDITQNASCLVHEYMATLWLSRGVVDVVLEALFNAFRSNTFAWRVRLSVLKFLQVSVYSNIYVLEQEQRNKRIQKLIIEAIQDPMINVRREAANCLLLFVHCDFIHISEEDITDAIATLKNENEHLPQRHGAAFLLSSVALAFPFTLPPIVVRPLRALCEVTSKVAILQKTSTRMLREFRSQHRSDWAKTSKKLGKELTFSIENAIAPTYYA